MNILQDIKPVTYLKSKAADLLKQINETHRPVIITQNGEPEAILQDPKSYENMRNAIGILKPISQSEDEIRSGNSGSQQEVFENIENFLKEDESSRNCGIKAYFNIGNWSYPRGEFYIEFQKRVSYISPSRNRWAEQTRIPSFVTRSISASRTNCVAVTDGNRIFRYRRAELATFSLVLHSMK